MPLILGQFPQTMESISHCVILTCLECIDNKELFAKTAEHTASEAFGGL